MQIAIDVDDVILFCQTLVSLEGTMSSSEITQTAKVLAKHGLEAIRLAYVDLSHVYCPRSDIIA